MMNSDSFIHQSFAAAERAPGAAGHSAEVGAQQHHQHQVLRNSPAAAPSPTMHHAPSIQPQQQFHQQHSQGGGGLLYNNLIPGHYRYGAKPPAPPPGPLSYQQQKQQHQQIIPLDNHQYNSHQQQQQMQHHHVQYSSSSAPRIHHNVAPSTFAASSSSSSSRATEAAKVTSFVHTNTATARGSPKHPGSRMGHIMKVSEPEDEDFNDIDDDLLVVKLDDDDDDNTSGNNDDDEQYYRPFRHQSTTSSTTITSSGKNTSATSDHLKHDGCSHQTNSKMKSNGKNKSNNVKKVVEAEVTTTSPGVDLLALLLLDETVLREEGGIRDNDCNGSKYQDDPNDIALLIRDASVKSQRARSLTHALAGEVQHQPTKTNNSLSPSKEEEKENRTNTVHNDDEKDNDRLYAAASNAHFEAALSYRRVYQTLFAMLSPTTSTLPTLEGLPITLTSSSEKATDRSTSWRRRTRSNRQTSSGGMTRSSEWELAKSMLMLSDMHARTAKSMYGMGLKWNMIATMAPMATATMQNNATTAKGGLKVEEVDGGSGGVSKTECGPTGIDTTRENIVGVRDHQAGTSSSTKNDKQRTNISNDKCGDIKDKNVTSSTAANAEVIEILPTPPLLPPQHERLRMAVRRALDTANHEEDITNSTFLGRSTYTSTTVTKQSTQATNANNHNGNAKRSNKNKVAMIAASGRLVGGMQPSNWSTSVDGTGGSNDGGVNPVDELMKLEKELRCMDMALEMGSSIANLGGGSGGGNAAASSFRPDGSFCVVPPGSSYASSSSMWTSGIIVGGGGAGNAQTQHQQQQQQQHLKQPSGAKLQGNATARSRANRLQNFLGGGGINNHANLIQQPKLSPHGNSPSYQQQPPETQVNFPADNAPLDQSWWGGGQGSVMASSAILSATAIAATTSASQKMPQPTHHNPSVGSNRNSNDSDSHAVARQSSSTTNARQLMQLMDSLNRLGNENAQLMREVEGAKAARAEAKAAKDMMAKFKDEYSQRFSKLKEALMKHNSNPHVNVTEGNGSVDGGNVVANSSYMKSSTMLEIQKRDQIIKQLSNDLKKERDKCKRKDSALQKYEAFYREVKARSAEKARQRQQQLQKEKHQQKQMQPRS